MSKSLVLLITIVTCFTVQAQSINRVLVGKGNFQSATAKPGDSEDELLKALNAAEIKEAKAYLHTSYDLVSYRLEAPQQLEFKKLVLKGNIVSQIIFGKLEELATSSCSSIRYGHPCEIKWVTQTSLGRDSKVETRLQFLVGEKSFLVHTSIRSTLQKICGKELCMKWNLAGADRFTFALRDIQP